MKVHTVDSVQLIAHIRRYGWRVEPELADILQRNREALEAQRAA